MAIFKGKNLKIIFARNPQPPVCEVCGEPATPYVVQDWKEAVRYHSGDSKSYAVLEPDGEPHHYCNEHNRECQTTLLQSTIVSNTWGMQ